MRTVWIAAIAGAVLVAGIIGWTVISGQDRPAFDAARVEATMADAESAYADTDYERVAEILSGLAEQGVPLAQYRLGLMYRVGQGVAVDEDTAVLWLSRAVGRDYAPARAPLAEIYLARAEQAATLAAGVPWYEQAADLGQVDAQAVMGSYYLTGTAVGQDTARGIALLTAAAEAGDVRAQSNLGYAYTSGTGVVADDAAAFRWYLAAAEGGLVRAQAAVGLFYETGRGTEVDLPEAIRWYLNANAAGAPGTGARLGRLAITGVLDGRNTAELTRWVADAARADVDGAVEWLEAAAEDGSPAVLNQLAGFYETGEVLPQNSALALENYRRAAEAGSADAQLAMARRYATGNGVAQDYVQAHVWANLAAAAGVPGAADERTVFSQFLSPEDLAVAQARATAWRAAHREP